MRILNVRLKNINSLAGEWVVDLEHPEYQDNGIFLITGPTGAGKTTLLDAICLALYGRTPRVGTISQSSNDVMTRHTNDCMAEVTFEAGSGRYRARWSQEKAKASGNLQKIERTLSQEDGKILSTQKREFEDAIKNLTGLEFEQFTRAILLAQGHFADFLNGNDKAKASILEKLTDITIYTDLSIACNTVLAAKKAALEDLEAKVADLKVLSPEEEAAKKALIEQCRQRLEEIAAAITLYGEQLTWLRNLEDIKKQAQNLEIEKRNLEIELAEFVPKRQEMENARRTTRFEGAYAALVRDRELKKEYLQKCLDLDDQLQNLQNSVAECGARLSEAQKKLAEATADLENARPLLEQARSLDKQINEKNLELQKLITAERQSKEDLQKKSEALEKAVKEKSTVEENIKNAASWLEAHAADQWLVENMAAMEEKLRRRTLAWQKAADAEQTAAASHKDLEDVRNEITSIAEEEKQARKTLADRQNLYDDIRLKRDAMLNGQQLEDLRNLLDSTRQSQTQAALYKSLEQHRNDLVDGEPCPCCGSKEHPFASDNLPDPDQLEMRCRELEAQIKDVVKLEDRLSQIEREKDNAANELKNIHERQKGLREKEKLYAKIYERDARRAADARKEAMAVEAGIRADLAPLELDNEPDLSGVAEILRTRLDAWRQKQQEKTGEEARLADLSVDVIRLEKDKEFAQNDLAEKETATQTAREVLANLSNSRNAIFEGKNADSVEDSLKEAIVQAQASHNLVVDEHTQKEAELHSCQGEQKAVQQQFDELVPRLQEAETCFASSLAENDLDEAAFLDMRRTPEYLQELEQEAESLATRKTELETRITENKKKLEEEEARALTDQSVEGLEEQQKNLQEEQTSTHNTRAALQTEIDNSDKNRAARSALDADLDGARAELGRWRALYNEIGGDKDTSKFKRFAQNVTLDLLLTYANTQLAKMSKRYILQRATSDPLKNMEIEVIDNEHGGETRSIKNLSGGEVFIASLALALGLSAMSGKSAMLGSLFLDEGFGTLDSDTLETAIQAIGSLRQEGKLIGIISHVESLADRIPTQIHVQPAQMGRSTISGPGCERVR